MPVFVLIALCSGRLEFRTPALTQTQPQLPPIEWLRDRVNVEDEERRSTVTIRMKPTGSVPSPAEVPFGYLHDE